MRLNPRYDGDPILQIATTLDDVGVPLVRQRARFATSLGALDESQWAVPSRCDGWTAQDVVIHLTSVNQFWALSIAAGLAGEPTRFLVNFDPVATPAQMVDASRAVGVDETLERFVASNASLAGAIAGLDDDGWSTLAEAPPGHIELRALALHALWDSWIHERDVMLPLGLTTVGEPDEIAGSLQYAAALGPAFLASAGSTREGALRVEATDPDIRFTVEVGPSVVVCDRSNRADVTMLAGDAVELLEALSFRAPLPSSLAADDRWMIAGLATAFDTVV